MFTRANVSPGLLMRSRSSRYPSVSLTRRSALLGRAHVVVLRGVVRDRGEGAAISLVESFEWNLMASIQRYLRQEFEFRVVEALPKTPTAKVRKLELRETGVTRDTWDREAAGVRVRREKIGG